MADETPTTRTALVDRAIARDARELLLPQVRLRFTEKTRWWVDTVFTITGPAFAVDAAVQAIEAIELQHLLDIQW